MHEQEIYGEYGSTLSESFRTIIVSISTSEAIFLLAQSIP